jgi:purine-nucleoside phosphorylase
VTNVAAGLSDQRLDHADVLATAQTAATRVGALLATILPEVG